MDVEAERRERIFNEKLRTIGVDKQALDLQLQEKKRQEEAAKREQDAYDAEVNQRSKAACLIQRSQEKEKRAAERALATLWRQNQQPRSRLDQSDGQMMLPGLVGEDPEHKSRQRRQREQLRDWLIQQQDEQQAVQRWRTMEEQNFEQSRAETDREALELQNLQSERRRAAIVAATNYNLAKMEEKRNQERERDDEGCTRSAVGVPGIRPGTDLRPPPETLQQVVQFQRRQAEQKKIMELEKKEEEEMDERVRRDSVRAALLMERRQAKLSRQQRRNLDGVNAELAETQRQQRPDLKTGHIDDSFFSKFNTCSR